MVDEARIRRERGRYARGEIELHDFEAVLDAEILYPKQQLAGWHITPDEKLTWDAEHRDCAGAMKEDLMWPTVLMLAVGADLKRERAVRAWFLTVAVTVLGAFMGAVAIVITHM